MENRKVGLAVAIEIKWCALRGDSAAASACKTIGYEPDRQYTFLRGRCRYPCRHASAAAHSGPRRRPAVLRCDVINSGSWFIPLRPDQPRRPIKRVLAAGFEHAVITARFEHAARPPGCPASCRRRSLSPAPTRHRADCAETWSPARTSCGMKARIRRRKRKRWRNDLVNADLVGIGREQRVRMSIRNARPRSSRSVRAGCGGGPARRQRRPRGAVEIFAERDLRRPDRKLYRDRSRTASLHPQVKRQRDIAAAADAGATRNVKGLETPAPFTGSGAVILRRAGIDNAAPVQQRGGQPAARCRAGIDGA